MCVLDDCDNASSGRQLCTKCLKSLQSPSPYLWVELMNPNAGARILLRTFAFSTLEVSALLSGAGAGKGAVGPGRGSAGNRDNDFNYLITALLLLPLAPVGNRSPISLIRPCHGAY